MGLTEWIERKIELTRVKNQARADALKSYYQSDVYKNAVSAAETKKMKEGKNNDFNSWIKRVSNNLANSFNNETIKIDKEKLFKK